MAVCTLMLWAQGLTFGFWRRRLMSRFGGIKYLLICRDFVKLCPVARGQICLFWYPFGTRLDVNRRGASACQSASSKLTYMVPA